MALMLNDLLRLTEEELQNTRVRLNQNDGEINAIDLFIRDPEKLLEWNYWSTGRYSVYSVGQISIGLVAMGNDDWLLFTVGEITRELDVPPGGGVGYEYETLNEFNHLFGRVIIHYHRDAQQAVRKGPTIMPDLIVREIRPAPYTGFDFPGYDRVRLSYAELATIVNGDYPSYRNALENQKAIYLQTDKKTGKLYVGSATAEKGMLLARWRTYIKNGHGGNVGLKDLVTREGFDYIKENFQYSILEIFNSTVADNYILARESYWKDVLQSREHGYNGN